MASFVALVRTRPETLPRDAARALALAGRTTGAGPRGVSAARAVGPHPTGGVPNWTLAALTAACPPGDGPPLLAVAGALHPRLGACACVAALAGAGADELAAAVKSPQALLDRARRAAVEGPWLLVDLTVASAPDGRAVMRNRLLAGRDPLALDAWTARCLGWDPGSMPLLRAAHTAGWRWDAEGSALVGDLDGQTRSDAAPRPWRPERRWGWVRRIVASGSRRAAAARTPWHALGDDVAAGRDPAWEVAADA